MKIFRLFLAVIVLQTLTVVAQSFGDHGRSAFLRRKRLVTSNNNTCSTQQLKSHIDGAILKTPQEGNSTSFHHGDKVEFVCKDGYHQVGQLKSFICQGDGNWNESTSNPSGKTFTLRWATLANVNLESSVRCKQLYTHLSRLNRHVSEMLFHESQYMVSGILRPFVGGNISFIFFIMPNNYAIYPPSLF